MLKATKVYCYEQGCKSMLSVGGDDLAKLTRLQMSNFLLKMK